MGLSLVSIGPSIGSSPARTSVAGGSSPASSPGCTATAGSLGWRALSIPMSSATTDDRRSFRLDFLGGARLWYFRNKLSITIPPALLRRAGLGKEAVLLGQVDRIEIWDAERLRQVTAEPQSQLETLADEVLGRE